MRDGLLQWGRQPFSPPRCEHHAVRVALSPTRLTKLPVRPHSRAMLLALVGAFVVSLPQEPATAPAPGSHTLRGSCQGVSGDRPVRVSLWRHDYEKESAELVRDTRAGADGSFAFADVPWLAGHDWGFRFFVLEARQGDRIAVQLLRGPEAGQQPVAVTLVPGVNLRGRVVSPAGKPVKDGAVRLQWCKRGEQWLAFADTPPPWTTRTAADGTFTLRGVPAGWDCAVEVVAAGCARARIEQAADVDFVFDLEPGATFTGRVVDEKGVPQARCRVCSQGRTHSQWTTTRTDDRGHYVLPGLREDTYNVWADPEDLTCAAIDSQAVVLGERSELVDLVVQPGGFFVGTVVDDATGKPMQPGDSADVAIYGPSRPRSGAACETAAIAPNGTFRIRVAPGSNYIYLRVGAGGYVEVEPSSFTLDVAAGQEQVVTFRVRKS